MADNSRAEQLNNIKTMGWIYFSCFLAFGIIGGLMIYCFNKNEYYTTNFWARVYIGSFFLAVVSFLNVFTMHSIHKAEDEGRKEDVSKGAQCLGCLLIVSIIGIGFASAFTGVFIVDSDVFQGCNTTEYTNDTLKKEDELCLEECKGYIIAHLVFLVIFFFLMVWGCSERSAEKEKLTIKDQVNPTQPKSTTLPAAIDNVNKILAKETNVKKPTTPKVTVQSPGQAKPKETDVKKLTKPKVTVPSPGQVKPKENNMNLRPISTHNNAWNLPQTSSTSGTVSECSEYLDKNASSTGSSSFDEESLECESRVLQDPYMMEQFEFTQQRQMTSDELYSHRHVAETPPPLASVCANQTHSLSQSRLPPIPRYKSIARIPTVPPPSYDEVISQRY